MGTINGISTQTVLPEWCECPAGGEPTFFGLAGWDLDGNPVFVHSECGKPSFGIWQNHEKYCDECGRSFSCPYDDLCESCSLAYVSWAQALQNAATVWPMGTAATIVESFA